MLETKQSKYILNSITIRVMSGKYVPLTSFSILFFPKVYSMFSFLIVWCSYYIGGTIGVLKCVLMFEELMLVFSPVTSRLVISHVVFDIPHLPSYQLWHQVLSFCNCWLFFHWQYGWYRCICHFNNVLVH
jgi:hypothetical protein